MSEDKMKFVCFVFACLGPYSDKKKFLKLQQTGKGDTKKYVVEVPKLESIHITQNLSGNSECSDEQIWTPKERVQSGILGI